MEDRWKTLAGVLAGGQFIAVALVAADTPLPLALLIANIPAAITYGVMRLIGERPVTAPTFGAAGCGGGMCRSF